MAAEAAVVEATAVAVEVDAVATAVATAADHTAAAEDTAPDTNRTVSVSIALTFLHLQIHHAFQL